MNDSEIEQHLAAIIRLNDGAQRIEFKTFRRILKKTVGADKTYSEREYGQFQSNPIAWMATRNPLKQSEELLRAMN